MSKAKMNNSEQVKAKLLRELNLGAINDNLSANTFKMYLRQLMKLYKAAQVDHQWSFEELMNAIHYPQRYDDAEFERIYKNKNSAVASTIIQMTASRESQVLTLNAICKIVKNRYRDAFDYYNKVRAVISKINKDQKMNNEIPSDEEEKYISYDELMSVPTKIKNLIVQSYGKLFLSHDELMTKTKKNQTEYIRSVFDYITVYLNVHYPLRLVWPTVLTQAKDGENYISGNKLYLNQFKNVRLMGPQVLDLDQPTMQLLSSYMSFLRKTLGERPEKVLYRVYNGNYEPYDYSSNATGGFSQVLSRLFVKYNGKPISMNVIRHIVESHIIQSPEYARLSNKAKNAMHAKLLHSFLAANMSYNKINNSKRSKQAKEVAEAEPEPDYSFEPDVDEPPPARANNVMSNQRSRRRERIFHGEIEPRNGNRGMEIDIYET